MFDFLRAHLRPLGQCLVQYALPVPLAGFVAAGAAQQLFFTGYHPTGLAALFTVGASPAVLLSYIPSVLGYVLLILTVYGYVLTRLQTPAAEPIVPARVGGFVRTHFLAMLGSFLGVGILVILAMLLFVVPGIWLAVSAALLFFVQLVENRSFSSALRRSVALVSQHWWATLGLLLIVYLIQSVLPLIVSLVGGAALALAGNLLGMSSPSWPMLTYGWVALNSLLSLVMYTLALLAAAFQYYNLIEIKEGRGVYALLEQLGKPAPTAGAEARQYQADEEGEY